MPAVNRPLSPHLQVYRPQLTSVLSISHRATGVALSLGLLVLIWQLIAAATGPDDFAQFQDFAGSWFGLALLGAWSLSLCYHLCNGIRHLLWDAGQGFGLPAAYRSGVAVIIGTVVLTAAVWIIALYKVAS